MSVSIEVGLLFTKKYLMTFSYHAGFYQSY